MKKLVTSFGFLVAVAATLSGCELYFDGHGSGGGSRPPTGSSGGSGYGCGSSTDCAAGCYCDSSNGTCTEGGFCSQDSDCGPGYHCNTDRSSCEPNPPGCTTDSDCPAGSVCDPTSGACTATCACMTDADAVSQGYGYCDETRGTCANGSDPNGSCAGAIACLQPQGSSPPTCPQGQVPLISQGCYTGACEAIAACDAAPGCAVINDESDCLGRTDCAPNYNGINCHKPDGTACHSGDTNCQCQSFVFDHCTAKGSGRLVH